ncbi:MAG: hypothetical protein HQK52_12020 [Oligoflexia bacterium]|nr:hypothetical protein [Oligoflexia bacterium]
MTTMNKSNQDTESKKWLNFILNLDKRIVYVFMFFAVCLPFFLNPVVDIKSTPRVQSAFDLVEEAAKNHKAIMIGFDYDPSTLAELQPMAVAFLRHAFSKNVPVVGINFLPNGTSLAASTMDQIAKEYGKKNGEDYVFMGYLPQPTLVLLNLGEDIRKSYKVDYRGIKVDDIPLLKNIQNYNDFHLVICISGTRMPSSYIVYGVNRYNFNYVAGVTAVSATEYYPFLQSGQMKGLLAGMKSAAEYESMAGRLGDGMRGMASQTWGHITIIIFIIIGNILYYARKRMDVK